MLKQKFTEKFLRAHWQRALVDERVYSIVNRDWKRGVDVKKVVKRAVEEAGVTPTKAQAAAIKRATAAVKQQLVQSQKEARQKRATAARQLPGAVKDMYGGELTPKESRERAARLLEGGRTRLKPSAMGLIARVPEDLWMKNLLKDLGGLQSKPILVRVSWDAAHTEAHEKFHQWQQLTAPGNVLRDEVSAHYLEGKQPNRISEVLFGSVYSNIHPLLRAKSTAQEIAELRYFTKKLELPRKNAARKEARLWRKLHGHLKDAGISARGRAGALNAIMAAISSEKARLTRKLNEVKGLESAHGLRRSFVATVLKNVPPHAAAAVIRYGIENTPREKLPLKRKG